MIIAISGVDGSGKSTATQNLFDWFEKEGKKPKQFYVGEYVTLKYLVKLLHLVFNPSKEKKDKGKSGYDDNPFLKKEDKNPVLKLWVIFTAFDNFLTHFKLKYYSLVGHTVICDRYFYDKLIGFEYHGYSSDLLSRIYLYLTPKPDLWIVLDVSEELSKKRETGGSHSLSFYKEIRKKYRKYSKVLNGKRIDVSDKSVEEVLSILIKQIKTL